MKPDLGRGLDWLPAIEVFGEGVFLSLSEEAVARWERFFNDPDPRRQLVARYIFEHVYLATLVLEEDPGTRFRLVRSATAPGQPVAVIGTALPYDDPYAYAGVTRFWYRLSKDTAAPIQKNLFLWRLGRSEIAHLTDLFMGPDGPGAHWDAQAPLHWSSIASTPPSSP